MVISGLSCCCCCVNRSGGTATCCCCCCCCCWALQREIWSLAAFFAALSTAGEKCVLLERRWSASSWGGAGTDTVTGDIDTLRAFAGGSPSAPAAAGCASSPPSLLPHPAAAFFCGSVPLCCTLAAAAAGPFLRGARALAALVAAAPRRWPRAPCPLLPASLRASALSGLGNIRAAASAASCAWPSCCCCCCCGAC